MRFFIAKAQTPFLEQPSAVPVEELRRALEAAGHRGEIVRVPFVRSSPEKVLDQLVALRLKNLESFESKLLIALDFPSSLIRHPRKVLWLDSTAEDAAVGTGSELAAAVAEACRQEQRKALGEAARSFATSAAVVAELRAAGATDVEVLEPPGAGWRAVLRTMARRGWSHVAATLLEAA